MDIQINQAETFKTLAGFFGREAEPVRLFSPIRRILRRRRWKGRLHLSKEEKEAHEVARKRFRWRISHAASTPLATRGRCGQGFELSSVCQRLELQFSPTKHEQTHAVLQDSQEASPVGVLSSNPPQEPLRAGGCPGTERLPNQRADWVWRAADQADGNSQQTASEERSKSLQPFSVLNEAGVSLQGKSLMTVGAPSLLNDYCKKENCSQKPLCAGFKNVFGSAAFRFWAAF
ncbi:uncharacterized protein LOC112450394 [Kryptolebias marmoratus]|uniref:uncharacterized protein LOC112450394 n=1 Tax=Kryptolebias marmoratus TaxID=37003 RepID=UPI0018ACE168|nr:uncharacterized protein LOC112450394 [Kryptolebias marmoratus]